jgi:hypothetical protein
MADTQPAPHPAVEPTPALGGSVTEAQEAILSLLTPEEEKPEEEKVEPTEVEESQPEEEDESFEEEEEEEASEEEDESESADEEDEEELYAVTVDGEEVGVNLDELMRGYSRQSDYTKKTQQIAEDRREIESLQEKYNSEIAQIQAERNQYVEMLGNIVQQSSGELEKFTGIDWQTLKDNDPIEYVTKREEYREAQEKIQSFRNQQAQVHQAQQSEMRKARESLIKEEQGKLASVMPEMANEETRPVRVKELQTYALGQGFTQEELDGLIDHRSVIVLDKARKYDEMQKANPKAKKLKNKPKVVRSGSGTTKRDSLKSKRSEQMKRLRGTGHINDASALLEDFIDI